MGLLLIALPSILGFARGVPESAVRVALGAAGLIVTFFTNHEYGVVRRIPMTAHLAVDGVAGAVLLVSPWVFGFADLVWVPHVILGLTALAAAFVTRRRQWISAERQQVARVRGRGGQRFASDHRYG
ncbi:MAG: SPW repeat protein [Acidobacteriota bacterium]|nr:SPW repeat protein [Acidobacteriota bacterium]